MFESCWFRKDEASRRNDRITRELRKGKKRQRQTIKVLLLGSGESGKSTFVKQMRILHGRRYEDADRASFKPIIYSNILKGMRVLCAARLNLDIDWQHEENASHAASINRVDIAEGMQERTFLALVGSMSALWKDSSIQTTFKRRVEYQLTDNVKYFLDNLERIGQINYLPEMQDILQSRKVTTNIQEYEFTIKTIPFVFVDIGGQRSQRLKWFQCFESVASILFVVSSSEYDQVLFEDRKTNRLQESLDIYEKVVNNRLFTYVCVIVFLNKSDLLEDKVTTSDIGHYFPKFSGDSTNLIEVQEFQKSLFKDHITNEERKEKDYFHCTTATDTRNIETIFSVVRENILRNNLTKINII